ncbi:MAG: hypothetical protein M3Z70_05405 [Bartonella sp.]|nr:hypothetical protein [Bartonella sp.]
MKPLPFNAIEAEQALLGAILLDNKHYLQLKPKLQAFHFSDPFHKQLWQWIGDMIIDGRDATPITLKPFVTDIRVGELTAFAYLVRLTTQAVGNNQLRGLAHTIFDCAAHNALLSFITDVETTLGHVTPAQNASNIFQDVEKNLFNLKQNFFDRVTENSHEAAIDRLMSTYRNEVKRPSIALPLSELTDVLSGPLEAGNLYGLLSSSGEGKTSLALQIMDYAARHGHEVFFFSYDQSAEQCLMQIASQRLGLATRIIRDKCLSKRDTERYFAELIKLRKLPLHIINCHNETIFDLVARLHGYLPKQSTRPPLVVVDHVRKVPPSLPNSHEGRIAAEIGGAAKATARENQLVWLNIMQRKSLRETRENPHPNDSDLFGGEQAKEDYDALLYLYRPEKYRAYRLSRTTNVKRREAICDYLLKWSGKSKLGALKVRFGDPTIWRPLVFEADYTRYASFNPTDQPIIEGFLNQ